MSRMSGVRSPLPWNGSMHRLARRIIKLMQPHKCYVETHFGGGCTLFAKDPEGTSEVVNDVDKELTNFWEVIRHPTTFESFYRRIDAMPYSEVEFNSPVNRYDNSPVGEAMRFFVRFCQSRPGSRAEFHTPTPTDPTIDGMHHKIFEWTRAIKGLPEAHERLKRVAIINRDAVDVIRDYDSPDTLFYCDPPPLQLMPTAQTYSYGSSHEGHVRLLRQLENIKGKFILSGSITNLYEAFADRCFWGRCDFDIPIGSDTDEVQEVSVYCNF